MDTVKLSTAFLAVIVFSLLSQDTHAQIVNCSKLKNPFPCLQDLLGVADKKLSKHITDADVSNYLKYDYNDKTLRENMEPSSATPRQQSAASATRDYSGSLLYSILSSNLPIRGSSIPLEQALIGNQTSRRSLHRLSKTLGRLLNDGR